MTILGENLLFQRTGIDSDADGDTALTAGIGDRLDSVVRADVAGIDADFIYARGASLERQLIVKVDIRDNRRLDRFFERRNQSDRVHIGNRGADNLTPCLLERFRLSDGAFDICGRDIEHGLHADLSAAADEHIARLYLNFASHNCLLHAREGSRNQLPYVLDGNNGNE